jgi:hypothetical protein
VDGKVYPDHGEVCRVSFSYKIEQERLVLQFVSLRLGYSYQKVFSEANNGGVRIEYEIVNQLETPLNALWAAHCLVRAEQGGKIIVPFQEGDDIDCVYNSNKNLESKIDRKYSIQ